jgi:hypothetical protein
MTRLLITADTVGGVWQYTTDLAAALAGNGIDPIVVTLGSRPLPQQRAALAGGVELIETDLPLDWLKLRSRSCRQGVPWPTWHGESVPKSSR